MRGHTNKVTCVVMQPTGNSGKVLESDTIISASLDRSIKVWNCITGGLMRTLDESVGGHKKQVDALVLFGPNREFLASGSNDTTIKIWRHDTGELVRTLTGHMDSVSAVAADKDAIWLVSAPDPLR